MVKWNQWLEEVTGTAEDKSAAILNKLLPQRRCLLVLADIDVAVEPITMKKGRSGHALTALVDEANAETVRTVWFAAGSSIGLRERCQSRWVLPRRHGLLETPWGLLAAKQVQRPDGHCTVKPEADALEALQQSSGCSVDQLRAAAAVAPFSSDEAWS